MVRDVVEAGGEERVADDRARRRLVDLLAVGPERGDDEPLRPRPRSVAPAVVASRMPGGQAYGPDRAFQELCRDICIQRAGAQWGPQNDSDGIDVAIGAAGTTWRADVALENSDNGDLLIAECKRWRRAVPQGEVAKLALLIERVRQQTGRGVSGLLFVKTDVQPGAIAHACHEGIEVVISPETQPLPTFSITVLTYDPVRETRLKTFLVNISDTATATDCVAVAVTRPDGTVER